MSAEATLFPLHEVKWTLSWSARRGKSLLYISSCPPQVIFGSLRSELQIPPNQEFPHVKRILRFKEFGTYLGGKGSLEICQVVSWSCTR